jgi:hypothetical protein
VAQKRKTKSNQNNVWLLLGAVALMAVVIWVSLRSSGDDPNGSGQNALVQTLAPAKFTGRARDAYIAAKEIPQILNQLPCYCGCMHNFGHKSNLYCFHDEHGADCSLCQDIALDARAMYHDGKSIDQIRETIRNTYARYAP